MVAHYAVADEIAIATSVAHATRRLLSATDEFRVLWKPATFEGDNAICPLDNKCLARKVQRRSRRIQGLFCCHFRGSELFPIARDSHQSPPGALGHVRSRTIVRCTSYCCLALRCWRRVSRRCVDVASKPPSNAWSPANGRQAASEDNGNGLATSRWGHLV